jgi:squalene-hopene/tetraprenyl-beta-curcumene cyclase
MIVAPTAAGRRAATLESAARAAVRRACDAAWATQRPEGHWDFPADCGPSSTAYAVIALSACGALEAGAGSELSRGIAAQQLPDGSFQRFALAPEGHAPTSALAAAALELAGGDDERAAAARAWAFVERHGGLHAVARALPRGELALAFLVAAGRAPAELLRHPGVELFAVPGLATGLTRRMHAGVLTVIAQLAFLARGGHASSAPRRYAFERAMEFVVQFQNDEGSYNTFTMPTALAACAYAAYGSPEATRRAKLAAAWIAGRVAPSPRGGAWVPEFRLPTWSTVYHLRALLHAGAQVDDPRVGRAVAWLLATQQHRPQARLNQPDPSAPRVGGWAFDPENHTLPDCDDTGAVLSVLAMARDAMPAACETRAAIDAAAARAAAWLGAMQNADGGWAAYVKGLPGKAPGPMNCEPFGLSSRPADVARLLISPPPALGDPSTEDVTARVLHGLAGFGATVRRADVRRAVAFLRRQQCDDGSFWGRWLMNHLAGSSYALQAAHAIGETLDAPWVARTAAWVLERQNRDGSWGETLASYRDPSLAGRGEGMAPLTGLVVASLCAVGLRHHPAVRRAVEYLLARQRPDGVWPDDGYIVPYLPPETFYAHPETALYYPLEALARFCGSPYA